MEHILVSLEPVTKYQEDLSVLTQPPANKIKDCCLDFMSYKAIFRKNRCHVFGKKNNFLKCSHFFDEKKKKSYKMQQTKA